MINFDVHAESPLCSACTKLASGVRGVAGFALNGTAQGVLEGFLDRSDPMRSGLEGGVGRPPSRRSASLCGLRSASARLQVATETNPIESQWVFSSERVRSR